MHASPLAPLDPSSFEATWQAAWAEQQAFAPRGEGEPTYVLEMFPYPSGDLHMGHVRNYTIGDVYARFARQLGRDVLHPMGWDALGLPAENQAILEQVAPQVRTPKNIAQMRGQMQRLGLSYDWSREIASYRPDYYRWNQWFFLRFMAAGWVYRRDTTVNWCPTCQTVLANEQVHDNGSCWRGHAGVTTRRTAEWAFRTTAFAEGLLEGLGDLDAWPERVVGQQRHWLGRSEGARLTFSPSADASPNQAPATATAAIEIFTTRLDTVFGCTFLVLAAEHPAVAQLTRPEQAKQVADFVAAMRDIHPGKRAQETERRGVFTGSSARHPLGGEPLPIWVGSYVVADYGTGAVMGVPAHDARDHAFATTYSLPIKVVVEPADGGARPPLPYACEGVLVDSGAFTGMSSAAARDALMAAACKSGVGCREVNWHLRDWGFSRQRYWGTPIPVVYCDKDGVVPVPESDLPVALPDFHEVSLDGKKGAPLARLDSFVHTVCPRCGGPARRETETMDTFVDSAWYFARFTDPTNVQAPFDPAAAARWLPVDVYVGGPEHAVMHLLYFRFWTRAMRALGLVAVDEPVRRLVAQGMVQAPAYRCAKDGYLTPAEAKTGAALPGGKLACPRCQAPLSVAMEKMSKSKRNGVDPNQTMARYGADCARLFCLFAAPPEKDLEWSEEGIEGIWRFLQRVWRLLAAHPSRLAASPSAEPANAAADSAEALRMAHTTLAKVDAELRGRNHFNTAIAALMELCNGLTGLRMHDAEACAVRPPAADEALALFAQMLCPFAPHLAEQMWQKLGRQGLCSLAAWPAVRADAAARPTHTLAVQVNGRRRGEVVVSTEARRDDIVAAAGGLAAVAHHLAGRELRRTVLVPGRLVNFVVGS